MAAISCETKFDNTGVMNDEPRQTHSDEPERRKRGDDDRETRSWTDTAFLALDQIALLLVAFGLGFLVLQHAARGDLIAWIVLIVGVTVKILLRAL